MKRTPLARKTPLKADPQQVAAWKHSSARKATLAPVSAKRVGQNVLYRRNRNEYLMAHPLCEWPGCHRRATQLHHSAGRVGALLWDKTYFKALCEVCHRKAHDFPREAKAAGVSVSRLGEND